MRMTGLKSRVAHGVLAIGLAVCGARPALGFDELYFVTDLGPLGAGDARDINEFGLVVGTTTPGHAYWYLDFNGNLIADPGELIDLGALPGQYDQSKAFGVSTDGRVSGWSRSDGAVNHAIVWTGAGLEDLGPDEPGGESGAYYAYGVNSNGVVVGRAGDGAVWPARWVGGVLSYLWDPVGNTGQGNDINDAGQVVGWRKYQGVSGRFAYVLQGGVATDLGQLGGSIQWAEATAISNFGYIVGWATVVNGDTHAFLRTPHGPNSSSGNMVDLGTFGGNYSAANGVNDRGQVVGVAKNQFDQQRAFLYSNGEMVELNTLVDNTEWTIEIPYAINNKGQIVALGHRTGQNSSGLLLTPNDTDGDGLFDVWEEQGGGIDVDSDGTIDLDLYALGARPDHKDLFVEVDAMVGRAPSAAAINGVVASFNAAPVNNPDGVQGIKLHVSVDETDIPRVPWNAMIDVDGDGVGDWPTAFDPTKAARFGTAAQRAHANAANILAAKRLAYRYCIFADTFAQSPYSGIAELPGNDFFVSLGSWTTPGGTAGEQAGTFMHEFGHTLGLRHGGGDNINFKPNYHSVMSYTFQTPHFPGWQPVYSMQTLPTLDESDLDETAGIGGSVATPVRVGPVPAVVVRMGGAVDFNRDGVADDVGVVADLNHTRMAFPSSPGDVLRGFNDWPAIIYAVTGNGDFAEGVHLTVVGLVEMTQADHDEIDAAQFLCDACDANCDGTVTGADIDAFVSAVTSPSPALCAPCAGDVNGDGTADSSDIDLFVECLMGSAP